MLLVVEDLDRSPGAWEVRLSEEMVLSRPHWQRDMMGLVELVPAAEVDIITVLITPEVMADQA